MEASAAKHYPNRDKRESKTTRSVVVVLLVASAIIITIITIGGWDKLQGAKPVNIFYVLVYLLFAYYAWRWNRGVLPVVARSR